jgi:peroxiredoxin
MESKIKYNEELLELTDDFIDIGYMAENIEVSSIEGEVKEVKRSHSDNAMTLLVSFPTTEDTFVKEMLKLDEFMSHIEVPIYCYFISSEDSDDIQLIAKALKKFEIVIDSEEEFGNMYGTKIVSGSLEDKLTKALFLISKDGAVFYLQMPDDMATPLDMERLKVELNKAYVTYTGVGCHG